MAKKGGVQQLQLEVNTDEELAKFLEKDGLLVLDVYTEWCGPCLAMVGSLKKIKLEKGGDDLQLAVVKSDNITVFQRFRNKSEPTWLFASHGKLVNGAFGSNVPELMALICQELELERKYRTGGERHFMELTDMVPCELKRYEAQLVIQQEVERIEKEAAIKKRRDYITFVTDEISTQAADFGITLCMPHVITKDILKRLTEHSDKIGLVVKDKRNIIIKPDDLELLHFEIENPLPMYMLDILYTKEAFFVCWKNGENELRPIEEVLTSYVYFMGMPQPTKDEEADPNIKLPPILKSLPLELTPEQYDELFSKDNATDSNEVNKEQSASEATEEAAIKPEGELIEADNVEVTSDDAVSTEVKDTEEEQTNGGEGEQQTNGGEGEHQTNGGEEATTDGAEGAVENVEEESKPEITDSAIEVGEETQSENQNDTNPEDTSSAEETQEAAVDEGSAEGAVNQNETSANENGDAHPGHGSSEESRGSVVTVIQNVSKPPEEEDKNTELNNRMVQIPPMWTPANKRATAAFIYVYFRNLTEGFLPPDPVPDPPHVAMCFDAYKRKELMAIFETYPTEVLAYGYFTTDDTQTAKLIANSTFKYQKEISTIQDRLIAKVVKHGGTAMAVLSGCGPCYVSQNTEIGFDDCKIFFPDGYRNSSETGAPDPEDEKEEEVTKKKKKKKRKQAKDENKDEKGGEASGEAGGDGEEGEDEDGDDDDEGGQQAAAGDPDTLIESVDADSQI